MDSMIVKVIYKNQPQEVMITKGGMTREAISAAGIKSTDVKRIYVTGISVCWETPLRANDILFVE